MFQETVLVNCPWCSQVIEVVAPDLHNGVQSAVATRTWWSELGERTNELGCPACQKRFYIAWNYKPATKPFKVLTLPAQQEFPRIANREPMQLPYNQPRLPVRHQPE